MSIKFVDYLEIKENENICIINMPVIDRTELNTFPKETIITNRLEGRFNKIILFTDKNTELNLAWPRIVNCLKPNGVFYVIYPKNNNEIIEEIKSNKNIGYTSPISILKVWQAVKISLI